MQNENRFSSLEELRIFYEYAKLANPPNLNHADAILFLIKYLDWFQRQINDLKVDFEYLNEDDAMLENEGQSPSACEILDGNPQCPTELGQS